MTDLALAFEYGPIPGLQVGCNHHDDVKALCVTQSQMSITLSLLQNFTQSLRTGVLQWGVRC